MKTIKKYTRGHKFYSVSARLNYYEMLMFRELQKEFELCPSELIKKFMRMIYSQLDLISIKDAQAEQQEKQNATS